MQHGFSSFIVQGLQSVHDHELCSQAIGLVEDLCLALGRHIRPYTDDIMKCLMELLASNAVDRSIKPKVVSVFTEIAVAISNDFEVYFGVMDTLAEAAISCPFDFQNDDEELTTLKLDLKSSILYAYNGILLALVEKKDTLFQPHHIHNMLILVKEAGCPQYETDLMGSEFQKNALALLKDLLYAYERKIQPYLDQDFINLLTFASRDSDLKEEANKVMHMLRRVK